MAEEAGVELPMPPSISIAIEMAGNKHSGYTINDGGCCQCGIGIMIEEVFAMVGYGKREAVE
jgi:hypothetical protein